MSQKHNIKGDLTILQDSEKILTAGVRISLSKNFLELKSTERPAIKIFYEKFGKEYELMLYINNF